MNITKNRKAALRWFVCLSVLIGSPSYAFNPLKLHCIREDRQGDQHFLSEIHFRLSGTPGIGNSCSISDNPSRYEGEVLSFTVNGTEKKYISGYALFSIFYHDNMISGLTGDPVSRTDGSFTLSRTSDRNNGVWKFSYSTINGEQIDAEFKCIYGSPRYQKVSDTY
jgi:hypothetical protein